MPYHLPLQAPNDSIWSETGSVIPGLPALQLPHPKYSVSLYQSSLQPGCVRVMSYAQGNEPFAKREFPDSSPHHPL